MADLGGGGGATDALRTHTKLAQPRTKNNLFNAALLGLHIIAVSPPPGLAPLVIINERPFRWKVFVRWDDKSY